MAPLAHPASEVTHPTGILCQRGPRYLTSVIVPHTETLEQFVLDGSGAPTATTDFWMGCDCGIIDAGLRRRAER
jgi:hypothetical protein